MKNITLLALTVLLSLLSNAQPSDVSPVRATHNFSNTNLSTTPLNAANKGTGSPFRIYNLVDHLAISNPDILFDPAYSSTPFMWFQPGMSAIRNGAAGLVKDSITLTSYGMVFQPWWADFNNPVFYSPGILFFKQTNLYGIDSVFVYGAYGRNINKPSIVDTIRIAYSYGTTGVNSNLQIGYYPALATRYNVDSLFSASIYYDSVYHTMKRPQSSTGPTVVTKDILLHASDTGTFKRFGVECNYSVPAGNLFAMTVTFKSGENYTAPDTVYAANNATNPYKYGVFRPIIFKEDLINFPAYQKRNYNSGQFFFSPLMAPDNTYAPTWVFSEGIPPGPSSYQFPYIDFKVSCTTCSDSYDAVNELKSITISKPYPNPANSIVQVQFKTISSGKITAAIYDILGRTIESRDLSKNVANQSGVVSFNTNDLPDGIYNIVVNTEEGKASTRFVVKH